MELEPYRGADEDLVCSDFVGSLDLTGRQNAFELSDNLATSRACVNNLSRVTRKSGSDFLLKAKLNCDKWIKHLIKQPKSLSDELRHRDCLTRAMTVLCREITENTVIDCFELDLLISENCIAGDDKMYIDANSLGTMQRTRRLLSLILLRDYKTLLSFLSCLLIQNKHVVEKILQEFQNCLQSNYRKPSKCTLCHLESRVDVSLIVDDLLSYDENWLPFYIKVSQTEYVGPSKEVWQELIGRVGVGGQYEHISEIVLKALRTCGFHSDIVLMLQEDRRIGRNSLVCRCSGVLHVGSSRHLFRDSHTSQAPEIKIGKMFNSEQNNSGGKGMNNLSLSKDKDHNINELSPKTGHSDDINKDNTGKRASMKNLLYESKGRKLQILLKGKQNSSNHTRQVQTRIRNDDEKTKIPLDSNSYDIQHETSVLKPCSEIEEFKVETLKEIECLENSSTQSPGSTLIQMELLKIGILEDDEDEMGGEHEWSVSTLHSSVSCEVSTVKKRSTKDQHSQLIQSSQHKLDSSETTFREGESDRECCEQQMAFLKLGIHEYEIDQNEGVSYSPPSQDNDGSCNTVMRSSTNKSDMDKELVNEEQNMFQSSTAQDIEIERQISNLLIVLSFLICFFCSVMQFIYSIF